ncbi:hypothetical protein MO973_23195 [Paenibacillus sp. TRM 82003]|nr:hypothetical protein [Paenibacillus sp. TRM 82003]
MRILSALFTKKFDYAAFAVGSFSLLLFVIDQFRETGFSSSMLWNQVVVVFLYYLATKGVVIENLKKKGFEPVVLYFFFAGLLLLMVLANAVLYMGFRTSTISEG